MKKARKAFWHNIRFKYKLSIVNENTLEEVVGIHVSKLNGLSVVLVFCAVIFFIASLIIVFTPLRADSLQAALDRQNRYVINIRDILSGQVKADTVQSIDSLTDLREEELIARSQIEDEFRKQYEARERYNLTAITEAEDAAGFIFYRPVRGVMSTNFNPDNRHFGVDLTASPNETIFDRKPE